MNQVNIPIVVVSFKGLHDDRFFQLPSVAIFNRTDRRLNSGLFFSYAFSTGWGLEECLRQAKHAHREVGCSQISRHYSSGQTPHFWLESTARNDKKSKKKNSFGKETESNV